MQETNLKTIANAIREKDGTTAPIVADQFAERILAIQTGSEFSVPLIVYVEAGAVVTATNGDTVLTETASSDGTVTFILPKPGDWELTAVLDGEEMYPTIVTVAGQYNANLSFTGPVRKYPYSGEVQSAVLMKGRYRLEAWGAEGGYRTEATYAGKGGYSKGNLEIQSTTTLFIRVGGSGNTGGPAGGFNGGGKRDTYNGGGGASDIRIGVDDLNHRVIVAGGGGSDGAANKAGGYGGGENGESRTDSYGTGGFGGTQTGVSDSTWQTNVQSSGTANQSDAYGGFGFGGNGVTTNSQYPGAGGGGWYGGSGSVPDSSGDDDRGGGGGSGFVWTGQSVPSGFALESKYQLNEAETKNGSQLFISPSGAQETGHSGDGYVKITPIVQYTISVAPENDEFGTTLGGGIYDIDTEITVRANPFYKYKFKAWKENGKTVSINQNYTFTVTENRTLIAEFELLSSNLPEGYTGLEYISNPNLTYITGFTTFVGNPFNGRRFELVVKVNSLDTNGVFFGARTRNITNTNTLDNSQTVELYNQSIRNGNYTIPATTNIMQIVVDLPKKVFQVNDDLVEILPLASGLYTGVSPDLFGYRFWFNNKGNTQIYNTSSFDFSLYSFKIFDSTAEETGECTLDFVPCINPSGIVGVYDIANGQFYTSADTSKTFTAGPPI